MPAIVRESEWGPVGIDDLEPAAWTALKHPGSACVIAGPGAGKTEFLAQRAAYLLQTGVCKPPFKILAISFKRDAAENLADRVKKRCSPHLSHRFVSMTFDSFTKGLVDRFFAAVPQPWRPSRPYEVTFPKNRDINDFLNATRTIAPVSLRSQIASINSANFESKTVGSNKLPIDGNLDMLTGEHFAINNWWQEKLNRGGQSKVTFVMLNRLAELLLRSSPQILKSVRVTHPFIFIDEFQDTTYSQFDFLLSAFGGTSNVITAVGDDKQRIMVWAGARPDAFSLFEREFQALPIRLLYNFRSSPDLVRIQHVVARALDPNTTQAQSQSTRTISGDVAQIWKFPSEDDEAEQIASWIANEIAARGTTARDYAILVRQTADRFEEQLKAAMTHSGLRIRNESRVIGRTALQDLLVEEISFVGIAILRLAANRRSPESWEVASKAILHIRGVEPDDEVYQRKVESELVEFMKELKEYMNIAPPSEDATTHISDRLFEFLDVSSLAQAYIEYNSGDLLSIVMEAFRLHLTASAIDMDNWNSVLDNFEGKDHVPLMTVHKSKGLEYDSMIFVGLHDRAWWSHSPGDYEGLATFFVALSRAKQRAIFTFCEGTGRERVSDLYQLLSDAGVPEIDFGANTE